MIKSFRHKGLRDVLMRDDASGVRPDLAERCRARLSALQAAARPEDMNVPGSGFHALRGKPKRYAVKVNGPWRITFEWRDGDAWAVDLEQYH
ncbi:MAG TPA: type II toxin-antitoxin system RelE/ParE family toxin [Alphaproteobacteria bacterium]|nr:type II toxin-antitoxin system RelE/ParE family toxin [Alphaproteobacteria bacterium]